MRDHLSVCPCACLGGYADRQEVYVLAPDEQASVPSQPGTLTRRCSYCGCVYTPNDPPAILGYKDLEPAGEVSWVPVERRYGASG